MHRRFSDRALLGVKEVVMQQVWTLSRSLGIGIGGLLAAGSFAIGVAPYAMASAGQVTVHRSEAVQIAVVLDHSGILAASGSSARNAVRMAVERQPSIKGFVVQLNDFDGPCHEPGIAANVAAEVVANSANVAVIGHMCSPDEQAALPVYEQAGLVTVSGSATGPLNPAFGPDVFNSVDVPDDTPGESDIWYANAQRLPLDVAWRADYAARFGANPEPFADLYFDAATLVLDEIASASNVVNGDLVIDRAALASAVRTAAGTSPQGMHGATCWVNLDTRGYRVNDPGALDRCGRESGRVVNTSAFSITWDAANPEQIDSLVWRGISLTNTATLSGLPPGCHFAEFFGNSWTVGHYPFMIVGDSSGAWTRAGSSVQIASVSTGCEGSTGIGVNTTYTFFENGPAANSFKVERAFSFGASPADFDFRPYIPRLFPRGTYPEVLHPGASGTTLMTDSISPCEFGCVSADWDGSWFASNDPQTSRGFVLLRESTTPAALWIDMDGASNTTAPSALLLRPAGGFTGTVVETEVLCFFDSTTWPASSRSSLKLPLGCGVR